MPWKAKTHRPLTNDAMRAIASAKAKQEHRLDRIGRLYHLAVWCHPRTGLRAVHLASEPLCRACRDEGRTTPAREVDHVIPHRGDMRLFTDLTNLQSLCSPHHASKTAREVNAR
jgi:5-methylcytosine-specific restriction protein A